VSRSASPSHIQARIARSGTACPIPRAWPTLRRSATGATGQLPVPMATSPTARPRRRSSCRPPSVTSIRSSSSAGARRVRVSSPLLVPAWMVHRQRCPWCSLLMSCSGNGVEPARGDKPCGRRPKPGVTPRAGNTNTVPPSHPCTPSGRHIAPTPRSGWCRRRHLFSMPPPFSTIGEHHERQPVRSISSSWKRRLAWAGRSRGLVAVRRLDVPTELTSGARRGPPFRCARSCRRRRRAHRTSSRRSRPRHVSAHPVPLRPGRRGERVIPTRSTKEMRTRWPTSRHANTNRRSPARR
jgi:hypothetical protein